MELTSFFDKIYCINLKHRVDRWENCLIQFKKYDLDVERFDAVNGIELIPNGVNGLMAGEVGVIRSNYNVIKDAKEKGYKNIIIFEDDVELCDDFINKFNTSFSSVPKGWGFLYMGGNHVGGLTPVNDYISQIRHSYAIHAICVNEMVYDHILEILPNEKEAVDVTYAKLQQIFPSYVFRPHLAWQKDGHSDIQGGYQNYDFLRK
jgi:hypothetical protein